MTTDSEQQLSEYLKMCSTMNYGLTMADARSFSYDLALANKVKVPPNWTKHSKAGKDWMAAFVKRQGLSLRKPEACSLARNSSFNKHNVDTFMTNLEMVFEREPSLLTAPHRIYNLDETAVTTVSTPQRILAPKGTHQVNKVTSQERGEMTTLCCIIDASGNTIPPAMIFPRVNFQAEFTKDAPAGTLGLAAKSPWMTGLLFLKVLQHFITYSKCTPEEKSLLILDNHGSHLHPDVITMAKENGVILLTLPPHCSHRMQPLDVAVLGPFSTYYSNAMNVFHMHNPGVNVTIRQVGGFAKDAFNRAMTKSNIQSGFRKAGIYPFDKHVFNDTDFGPSLVTERSLPPDNDIPETTPDAIPKLLTSAEVQSKPSTSAQNAEISILPTPKAPSRASGTVTPEMVRPFPKLMRAPGDGAKKRRTKKSIIATDPQPETLAALTAPKGKGKKRKTPSPTDSDEDDESSSNEEIADALSKLDDSDDEYEESENTSKDVIIVEPGEVTNPEEGGYVLVEYKTPTSVSIYYVAKVLESKLGAAPTATVSCLRRAPSSSSAVYRFIMPDIPDISQIEPRQMRFKFAKPSHQGGTVRQKSALQFDCLFPTTLDVR